MAQGERHGWLTAGLGPRTILVVSAFFIVCYFGVSIVNNAVDRYELDREQDRLRNQLQSLESQQRRLDALKNYMQSDEFIERAGRDQGLIFPGDTPVFITAPTPSTGTVSSFSGPWWERYFGPTVTAPAPRNP